MSRAKLIQLSTIAVLLVLILLGYFFQQDSSRIHIAPWKGNVDRIVLENEHGRFEFRKVENTWLISTDEFRAKHSAVVELADSLNILQVSQLVSTRGDYERYDLDDDRSIQVAAYDGDTKLRSLVIGKASPTGQQVYARIDGDEAVYLLRTNLRSRFDRDMLYWRDTEIMDLDTTLLDSIAVDLGHEQFTLRKTADSSAADGFIWMSAASTALLDQDELQRLIREFDFIAAADFPLAAAEPEGYLARYRLNVGNDLVELKILEQANENNYLCKSSTSPYLFYMSKFKAERLLRGLEAYMADPDAD